MNETRCQLQAQYEAIAYVNLLSYSGAKRRRIAGCVVHVNEEVYTWNAGTNSIVANKKKELFTFYFILFSYVTNLKL